MSISGKLREAVRFVFADGGSLKARVVRSGFWLVLAELGFQLLNASRSVFLARLLTPEMFGVMAMAMIAVRALETFTRPGLIQALIARDHVSDTASATAFTMLVARGSFLMFALAACSGLIASFYETPILQGVLVGLSITYLISSFINIEFVAKQRELDFRRLTYLNQCAAALGTATTVCAAYLLQSVWALVIGQIATAALSALLSYAFLPGRPRFAFDKKVAEELFRYGKFVTGSSIVIYVASEIDSAVVGKILGADQLGFYALGATVANLATANVSKLASSILMPAYSRLKQDAEALKQAYLQTLSIVMLIVLPACAGVILLAEPFLRVVYGDRWLPAVPALQALAVFGLFRALAAPAGYLFEGIGKPKVAFYFGLVRLIVVAPIIVPMTLSEGIRGAAIAVTCGMFVQWVVGVTYLTRTLHVSIFEVLRAAGRGAWTVALMAIAVYLCTRVWDVATIMGLLGAITLGITVYLALNMRTIGAFVRRRQSSQP